MKKTTRTTEEVIEEIIEFFKEETETFNNCIEELDDYNGYLGDRRYYQMEDINEIIFADCKPIDILYRAYYGGDEDSAIITEDGTKRYGEFNPMREFYYFNGYGNLISSDFKNYEDFIEPYTIMEISRNREEINSTYYNDKLTELFDELDELETI